MAEKTSVGFLPGNDPEAVLANLAYQDALMKMSAALDARKNRMFDPEMLALAQGFLAPTQTGGFGESLGYAAKNFREAQAQQEKEEQELAQARLGLASKGLEVERLRQRDRQFLNAMGEPPGGLTTGQPTGALPSGQTTGGALPGNAPRGFEGVQGIPVAPPNPNFMTGRQYLGMARLDPSISPTTAIKDAQKMDMERFQVKEGGVQDLSTGMFFPFPKGEQVTRQIYGQPGEFKVDARTAALLDMYAANGDPRYYEVAERVVKGPKAPPKPGEKPEAKPSEAKPTEGKPAGETRIKSVTELEAEKAEATETAQQRARAREEERKKAIAQASDATARMGTYNMLGKIASSKEAPLIFGIFERPGLWPQIATLIESSIGVPGTTIGIPQIRKVMTNAGLPQELIDQSQFALSLMANIQLQISRLAEGQGQVSDFERTLFGMAGITEKDNPQTILAKLDMLRSNAEFYQEQAKALRRFKGNIDDFKLSDDYTDMVRRHEEKLANIVEKRLGLKPPERQDATVPRTTAPSGRDNKGAAGRLPQGI